MRKFATASLALLLSGSFLFICPANAAMSTSSVGQDFSTYIGKYPSDMFKRNPRLKTRLRSLLGANYASFFERIQTETPIEGDHEAIVIHGCMAHSCGEEEALLAISLSDNKLHCAILSQKFGGKYKIFSEDKNHIPDALNRAMANR